MVLSAIGRLIVVPLAFVLAAIGSLFVLLTLGLERLTQALHAMPGDQVVDTAFDFFMQAHLLIAGVTMIPAIVLIVVGEVARIRSFYYYVLGGGLAVVAVPFLARLGDTAVGAIAPQATVWQVFATAGFVGGFIYWMLAGRRA